MTNEELVQLIKQGNKKYYATLWEQTSRLIYKLIYKHSHKRKLPNDIAFEDLQQCGYFVMVNAVKVYNPEKDLKFNTYLEFQVMNAIQLTIDRGQRKGINTPRLQEYSYNRTVNDKDGNEVEIIDLMQDKDNPKIYEGTELTDLQEGVWQAVAELPNREQEIITRYYFNGESLPTLAEKLGVSAETIRQRKNKGLKLLRQNKQLRQLYFEFVGHSQKADYDRLTMQWSYSPEHYAIMQDIADRKAKGEYLSYGKQQEKLLLAFVDYMQTYSKKSANTLSNLYRDM